MNKILLIEDEAVIAMSLSDKLEERGFDVVGTAKDYDAGLELIESSKPNLVLLDINIQGEKNGIELGEKINQDFDIPFIYLTSYSSKSMLDAAKKTHPINYLFKNTFNEDQFMLTVELAMKSGDEYKKQNDKLKKIENILDNNSSLIMRLGVDAKVLYVNTVCKRFFGESPEDLYNKEKLPENTIKVLEDLTNKILKRKRKSFKETLFPTIMGERYVRISAVPELDDDRNVTAFVFEIQDITDQKLAVSDMLEKHKKIAESINYSKSIQEVLFPKIESIGKYFNDSFMINKPRDIIGGDFPFVMKVKNDIYIALVDCTGHGVPGALMSLIVHFLLSNILKSETNLNTGHILDILNISVVKTLKQHFKDSELKDGADMILLKFNSELTRLNFSSAHRPLFLMDSNKELVEIKGDKYPIGGDNYVKRKRYNSRVLTMKPGNRILIFSDGLVDQFDESGDFKYGYKPLRDILRNNTEKNMGELAKLIEKDLLMWRGNAEQTDDILAIGMEI